MCHNIPVRSVFVTSDVHTFPFYKNSCLLTQSFRLFLNASQCKSRTRNWWPLFALGGGVQIKILRRGRHLLFASHPRNRGTRWHISTHSAGGQKSQKCSRQPGGNSWTEDKARLSACARTKAAISAELRYRTPETPDQPYRSSFLKHKIAGSEPKSCCVRDLA